MKQMETLMEELRKGLYDGRLKEIYMDDSVLIYQRERYIRALRNYQKLFDGEQAAVYSVPGRSEVGGNHTDHQCGVVLAASVNLDIIAVAGRSCDRRIRMVSEGYGEIRVDLSDLSKKEEEEGTPAGLIRGVVSGLRSGGFQLEQGFDAYVTSDIPIGAGLSSSAAFGVMAGTIISGLFHDEKISSLEIARAAQYAENTYFGKPCGLMDQMACSEGGLSRIDFKDPMLPEMRKIQEDFETHHYHMCIVDTKGSHTDLTEEYALIPEEMKSVSEYMGKKVLREVDKGEFFRRLPEIRKAAGDRAVLRAIHFFGENERAGAEADALSEGRFADFLELVKVSGNSSYKYLQNIYTCKSPREQGLAIGLAVSEDILGSRGVSRVHGGGFAGTIQAFVPDDLVNRYRKVMNSIFGEGSCHVLKVRLYGGIRVL
ncbi:galactokinase [Qiania dongpingensis]|uniref:Galactokinase n=1 Tax=Qiania dongpingensis TaxID=2763669 RepID=A0A7G9G5E3_9FIRM|nr:galactokinase family protein [Qiania dongpingensis]QNM06025.1 galactokinase [Qiania dongpingensis]